MYFPSEVQANPKFQERIRREVPLGRLVSAEEAASFAAYLCSDAANCFVGQVSPLAGGLGDPVTATSASGRLRLIVSWQARSPCCRPPFLVQCTNGTQSLGFVRATWSP